MSLSRDDVAGVAKLAKLQFSSEEIDQLTDQLGRIVSFVDQLNQVDTEGVDTMAHPLDVESVVREDQLADSLDRADALKNAPNQDGELFLVPPVMAK